MVIEIDRAVNAEQQHRILFSMPHWPFINQWIDM